jgi:hypothetical protein
VTSIVPEFAPTLAVTVAFLFVVSRTRAMPFASVVALVSLNVPAVVEKATGTPARGNVSVAVAPPVTDAAISAAPPLADTLAGFARTVTLLAAADPIEILTMLVAVVVVVVPVAPVAPPDTA